MRKTLILTAAAALALAVTLTGCPADEAGSVTVTFHRNFTAAEGSGNAPAAVTVNAGQSIVLPGRGAMDRHGLGFAGWNTQADTAGTSHPAGTGFTVNSDVALFAEWAAPVQMTVNIAGLPAGKTGAHLTLRDGTGTFVTSQSMTVTGNSASATVDAVATYYDIRLELWEAFRTVYFGSRTLLAFSAGANSFVLATHFAEILPMSITVTGINVAATSATIELRQGGNTVAISGAPIFDGTAYFSTLWDTWDVFQTPGIFELRLWLFDDAGAVAGVRRIASRNIVAGSNQLAFSLFQAIAVPPEGPPGGDGGGPVVPVPPEEPEAILISGFDEYADRNADLYAASPGGQHFFLSRTGIHSDGMMSFDLRSTGLSAGQFDLRLLISHWYYGEIRYDASGVYVEAGWGTLIQRDAFVRYGDEG